MSKKILTQAELKEQLHYNPITGVFTRLKLSKFNDGKQQIGDAVGYTCSIHGYVKIRILGVQYPAHKLAFVYMLDDYPKEIDHKDRVRNNNVWSNLRKVTRAENMTNKGKYQNNKSGVTGVMVSGKFKNRWRAVIGTNPRVYLGRFDSFFEAVCARKAAEAKYGYYK
ncbi:MAG: HNH endonuclease [Chloroflexota bacterium]|nr:MAG: HNH endonuclease [Chloroflexota bacterium]